VEGIAREVLPAQGNEETIINLPTARDSYKSLIAVVSQYGREEYR
jgi:hypothetical protein